MDNSKTFHKRERIGQLAWGVYPFHFPPPPPVPHYNDNDLMNQWRAGNDAGDGEAFGDLAWGTDSDIWEACHISDARFLTELHTPRCYLIEWNEDHWVVCDAHGWWAVPVTLKD